jgi:drug/metabolite transporter (DMT)-like permease
MCAITYAFYLAGTGRMVPVLGSAKFTTYSMLTATAAIMLHYFLRQVLTPGGHSPIPTGAGSGALWGYGILLALVATVIPSFMLSEGMKRIGANNAAIVTSIGPVSTILQAHFFLGDRIFAEQVVGTVLVIIGVLMIGWKNRKGDVAV